MTTMTTSAAKRMDAQDMCAVAEVLARHVHLPAVHYVTVGVYGSEAHASGSVACVEDVEAWAAALGVEVVHHGSSWWTSHAEVDTAAGSIEWYVSYVSDGDDEKED